VPGVVISTMAMGLACEKRSRVDAVPTAETFSGQQRVPVAGTSRFASTADPLTLGELHFCSDRRTARWSSAAHALDMPGVQQMQGH